MVAISRELQIAVVSQNKAGEEVEGAEKTLELFTTGN